MSSSECLDHGANYLRLVRLNEKQVKLVGMDNYPLLIARLRGIIAGDDVAVDFPFDLSSDE